VQSHPFRAPVNPILIGTSVLLPSVYVAMLKALQSTQQFGFAVKSNGVYTEHSVCNVHSVSNKHNQSPKSSFNSLNQNGNRKYRNI
jgi:hypothetical protein